MLQQFHFLLQVLFAELQLKNYVKQIEVSGKVKLWGQAVFWASAVLKPLHTKTGMCHFRWKYLPADSFSHMFLVEKSIHASVHLSVNLLHKLYDWLAKTAGLSFYFDAIINNFWMCCTLYLIS